MPPIDKLQNTAMGMGASISATNGAKIDSKRAKKLQIPRAVAVNKTGKISALVIYTIVKFAAIPPFAKVINIGTHVALSTPKNKISDPPNNAIQ